MKQDHYMRHLTLQPTEREPLPAAVTNACVSRFDVDNPLEEKNMTAANMIGVFKHALMITGFVFVMMLVVDYLNVLTGGNWRKSIRGHRLGQYFLASFLGVTPGCLGAFAVVSLYAHRIISVGALVAVMVATSGDESFVMLAMFPGKALIIFAALFVVGIISGLAVDLLSRSQETTQIEDSKAGLIVHEKERCVCFPGRQVIYQWRHCSCHRGALVFSLGLFLLGIISAEIGASANKWIRLTMMLTAGVGLFIVSTVPDHFLEDHLWNHIAKKHIGRIFLWTLGALLLIHVLIDHLALEAWIKESNLTLLAIACLAGMIPESGPHLVFVTLYAEGTIPFSILLANSIVQDGHGTLPLLAHSRRDFLTVKTIKVLIGFLIGSIGYFMGW